LHNNAARTHLYRVLAVYIFMTCNPMFGLQKRTGRRGRAVFGAADLVQFLDVVYHVVAAQRCVVDNFPDAESAIICPNLSKDRKSNSDLLNVLAAKYTAMTDMCKTAGESIENRI
jgi:hypothetical protein